MRSVIYLALFSSACCAFGQTYTLRTFAGGALPVNIPATSAKLLTTGGVAIDAEGNVFISLQLRHVVVRVAAGTGTLTLVAGTGRSGFGGDNGPATSAQLSAPAGIALDAAGNLYIADSNNHRIRRVSNGTITTVAGAGLGFAGDNGPATAALMRSPQDVAVDGSGVLYIADRDNHRIRRVAGGTITTFAGNGTATFAGDNGPATGASLSSPTGVAVDSGGNVYIADTGNHRIRVVSRDVIRTVAGNGTAAFRGDGGSAASAALNAPNDVAVDSAGDLYIADTGNHRIRRVSDGIIGTIAGTGTATFSGDNGPATSAGLNTPASVAVTAARVLYISDSVNQRIRRVLNATISTIAGTADDLSPNGDNGPATSARLNDPRGVTADSAGNVYIADQDSYRVRRVTNGVISTIAGTGIFGFTGDNGPATAARLGFPEGITVDAAGNLYIADWGSDRVRRIANGTITTIAGNGNFGYNGDNQPATNASLAAPSDVAVDRAGNVYISDRRNHRVRRVSNGIITTVAGNGTAGFSGDGGSATSASLNQPQGIAVDAAGNLYIADSVNHRIRRVSNGIITTVAGNGTGNLSGDNGAATSASLQFPVGVALDSSGNIYIADTANYRIRKVSGGIIRTIAGGGTVSAENIPGTTARLALPVAIEVDSAGNVYFADADQRVHILTPVPVSVTTASPLPNGAVGVSYSETFAATGGVPPYNWALQSGALPNGLVLNGATLSGTPTVANTFVFTMRARDAQLSEATKQFSLTIVPCTVTFTPSPVSVSASAGTGSVSVTRNSACGQWTATSSQSWLRITGGSPGTGNGTVQFAFDTNPSSLGRSATITLAGQSVTVNQAGTSCAAVFSSSGVNIGAAGGTATVTYTLPAGCTNTPTSNAAWLTAAITTPGTMSYTAAANTTLNLRVGTITLAGATFTVTQGASCTPLIDPFPITAGPGGGTVVVSVTRNVSCGQWTASSNQPWVRVTAGSPATGTANIEVRIDPNPSTAQRSATLTIAGLAVTVTQEGAPCRAVFTAPSALAPAAGATASVGFTLPVGCPATPASSASWLTAAVTAPGTLTYTSARNESSIGRTATITLAGATFTVSQGGAVCTFNLTPGSRTAPSAQATGTVAIASPTACGWTAVSDRPEWLRIQGAAAGSGTGNISYVADPNPSPNPRTATITINARTFTIIQNGTAPSMACTAAATPVVLRRHGITEQTADVNLSCTGVPAGGVTTDVDLTLSATVTSRVLNAAGTLTEALAILNNASTPVPGTSAWQAGLAGPNALRWKNVRVTANAQGQANLRLTNIRVNAHAGVTAVNALVELRSETRIGLINPSLSVATAADALTVNRGTVSGGPGANQTTVPLIFREQLTNAFRTRTGESGYFHANVPAGQADTATRLRIRLTQLPTSVRVFAPNVSAGGELARLVSADANGRGGAEIPGSGHTELVRSGSAVTATWEVKSVTGALDTLMFPLIIEGATGAQIDTIIANMQAGFAPVSTAGTAVAGAPVPRFADTSTFVPPVNLRIVPVRLVTGGPVTLLGLKDVRRLAVASSAYSNYDIYNDSSEPAAGTVVRSSAPAGFTFVESGTEAPGSSSVSYSADHSEAFITYNSLPAESSRSVRVQIAGTSDENEYIEILATVSSIRFDLDLSDNRASVGIIAETCPPNTLTPTSANFLHTGGTGQFNIGSSCSEWTVRSSDDWVTIDTDRAGNGSFTTRFTVKPNPSSNPRTTTIIAAGQTFTVNQAGNPGVACPLAVDSTGQTSAPAEGRHGQLGVTLTAGNCAWTARSSQPWLEVYPLEADTSIPVSFTVYPNFGTQPRSATVTIGAEVVTITQPGMTGSQDLRFVRRAYFNALRRLPRPDEEQFHLGTLTSGLSRAALMQNFLQGDEFRTGGAFVSGLYRVLLSRPPEYGGWAFQLNSLVRLKTPQPTLAGVFMGSLEWQLKQGGEISDEAFITLLYREAFNRTPGAAEIAFQVEALRSSSRAQIATNFLSGAEFLLNRGPLLNAVHAYFVILGRDPSPAELTNIENQLRSGTPFPSIIAAFVNSAEHNAALQ